jgi:hypothetical protein
VNGECTSREPALCGCCEGVGPETPQPITNRPALPVVAYRVGTHARFKASMLATLSDPDLLGLAGLRTRDDGDFSIALLDAWAVTADILSFYQERIANESYLRTAVDQRSVFELARLVGYRPSPGVAASAFVAFTLNDAPGSPDSVLIRAGSRVQSVPGPGQAPATYETGSDLTARIAYNAIPAQSTVPWSLGEGDTSTTIQGTGRNLNAGDGILFVAPGAADFHLITSAVVDSTAGVTIVSWDQSLDSGFGKNNPDVAVYVFRKKAALFGVQAPDPNTLSPTTNTDIRSLTGFPSALGDDWTFQYPSGSFQINLDASYPGLAPAQGSAPQWTVLVSPDFVALFEIAATGETGPLLYTLTSKTTRLTLANGQVLVNIALVAAWAAYVSALSAYIVAVITGIGIAQAIAAFLQALSELIVALKPIDLDQVLADIVRRHTRSATVYVQSERLPAADPAYTRPWAYDGAYVRQSGLLKPVEGSTLELTGGQDLAAGQPVGVSGKRLRLQVTKGSTAAFVPEGATGSLSVSDGQAFVIDAFPPADVAGGQLWRAITTNGIRGALRTAAANLTLAAPDKADAVVAETAVINQTSVAGAVTTLSFDQSLGRIYDRATVRVNGNTVAATHGESMHEILGNGDAANPALQFTLKQAPLTYVSSTSGLGAQSTLQIWVNNLEWHETGTLLEAGAADRVFVTRASQSGNVTVQFGDGVAGARPSTGQMNIRAVYRKGIGATGMVAADQLTQAIDRPQGLKGVTNPDPAAGGADPDTADDARTSAPLHTLTLERVVSLEDYENFARAFAGIAKALATWTWLGRTRAVFITVAGANGSPLKEGDSTIVNLAKALHGAGNPYVPLRVASYTPVLFEIAARIRVDAENYDADEVLGRVWQALSEDFAFTKRALGQGVAQSEVIAVIQQTAGVVAVELTAFNRSGDPVSSPLPAILRAASPIAGGNTAPQPAEMLLLDPASRGGLGAWS